MSAPRPPRCALARVIGETMDKDALKRDAWRKYHILVVSLDDDRLSMIDSEFVRQIGKKLYGAERKR